MAYLILISGLVILVAGAELLVRGAVVVASLAKISPLVIGLTVVAFGTSAPELAVSAVSSLAGDSEIALGNVVGSNIFNVLIILGLSALVTPLAVCSQLVRLDVPVVIGASVATLAVAYDGNISRGEGVAMLLSFVAYTGWLIRAGRDQNAATDVQDSTVRASRKSPAILSMVFLVTGLVLLVLGARLLVDSATTIAKMFGVSDLVIGLTVVAAGTSLPELATSMVAAVRGQRDIAVGNVVGSNVFNLLMVLGTAASLSSTGVNVAEAVLWFDLLFMAMVALLCWPVFVSAATVSRGEALLLLSLYVAYTVILVGDSQQQEWVRFAKPALVTLMPALVLAATVAAWRCRFDRGSG